MPYTRTIRRRQSIRVSGPAVITLLSPGEAKLSIDAPPETRIEADGPARPGVVPFRRPPRGGLDAAA